MFDRILIWLSSVPEIEISGAGRSKRERERGKWWCLTEGRGGPTLPHSQPPQRQRWMVEVGQPAGTSQTGITTVKHRSN